MTSCDTSCNTIQNPVLRFLVYKNDFICRFLSKKGCISIDAYDDTSIVKNSATAAEVAVKNDCEPLELPSLENTERGTEHLLPHEDAIFLREDLSLLTIKENFQFRLANIRNSFRFR